MLDCRGWLNVYVACPASLVGGNMRYDRRLILGLVLLLAALFLSACSSSDESSAGVAEIDVSQTAETPAEPAAQTDTSEQSASEVNTSDGNTNTAELTDEEITTLFTECLREQGLNIPDPVMNADGSVDLVALRQSIAPLQGELGQERVFNALEDCLPLLERATFAAQPTGEDLVELEDNLLTFVQCLRDEGFDVPDPDFSDGPRAAMASIIQGLAGANSRVEEGVESCAELVFGTGTSGR